MQVIITINKKPGVLDPEAQAIKQSLFSLGFDDLENVNMGKQITLFIETDDQEGFEKVVATIRKLSRVVSTMTLNVIDTSK